MPIRVDASSKAWARQFEQERDTLGPVLAAWLVAPVEHIGSTSVPGLAAKPIIDMMAGIGSLDDANAAMEPLVSLGYVHAEHRPDAVYFYRLSADSDQIQTHHLHLTEVGSPLWSERLAFRDALRADPNLAMRYNDLKIELASEHDDLRSYTDGKRVFITDVLAAAGITLQPR